MTEVTVPHFFAPSALGVSSSCLLKIIVASLRRLDWSERLSAGPEAAVGTLLHRILERASRGGAETAEEAFKEEYSRITTELGEDPSRAHFAVLSSTKPLAEWTRLRAWVLARFRTARMSAAHHRERPLRSALAHHSVTGSEVALESLALRLRGRADRIVRLGQQVFEVRDFKTGVTLDENGAVKSGIALQLQAYGLLLRERNPEADIRLVVDDGLDREVPFDEEARVSAIEAISRITTSMPSPGPITTKGLTRPCGSCWSCSIRHVCPSYRATAPYWWKEYPSEIERLSNDVWGTVTEVIGTGRVDVVLCDDAGRRVRIDNLDERHGISSSNAGSRLWFFGLEATGPSRGFDGNRFHPRSFHELPRDRMERRAWASAIFCEARRTLD